MQKITDPKIAADVLGTVLGVLSFDAIAEAVETMKRERDEHPLGSCRSAWPAGTASRRQFGSAALTQTSRARWCARSSTTYRPPRRASDAR